MIPSRTAQGTVNAALGSSSGGKAALANPREKTPDQAEIEQLKRRVGQLERALGRKTYELEVAGELSRDWE